MLEIPKHYKAQLELLNGVEEAKNAKMEKFTKIVDGIGQTANTATQLYGAFASQNQEGETKKKSLAPGELTERTKNIMKKIKKERQMRVNSLSGVRKYYA
jgi:hypothetical protein